MISSVEEKPRIGRREASENLTNYIEGIQATVENKTITRFPMPGKSVSRFAHIKIKLMLTAARSSSVINTISTMAPLKPKISSTT